MQRPDTDDEKWLRRFNRASPFFAAANGIGLLIFLAALIWVLPEPNEFQRQVARWFVAVASALLSTFFLGGFILRGSIGGWGFSAAGGVAIFLLLVTRVNPFPSPATPPGQPAWQGGSRIGHLVDILAEAYADGSTKERIVVDPKFRDEVRNFRVEPGEWRAGTWKELVTKICTAYPCLLCRLLEDGALQVSLAGEVEKRCLDGNCEQYAYSCKP